MNRLELFKKYELIFHVSDYKLKDAEFLFEFIFNNKNRILKFEEVKSDYGGDPLRFGPLISEFEQCGLIEVVKRNSWGQILEFRYNNTLWTKELL